MKIYLNSIVLILCLNASIFPIPKNSLAIIIKNFIKSNFKSIIFFQAIQFRNDSIRESIFNQTMKWTWTPIQETKSTMDADFT